MVTNRLWLTALVPLSVLSACAPRLSSQEQLVRVVSDRALLSGCEFLGPVLGEERLIGGVLLGGQAEANARARLRREAVRLGGNAVVIADTDTGVAGSQVLGEAYRCADGSAG